MGQQIHIGSKGTQVTFPAGYMNRAVRREYKRLCKKGIAEQVAKVLAFKVR